MSIQNPSSWHLTRWSLMVRTVGSWKAPLVVTSVRIRRRILVQAMCDLRQTAWAATPSSSSAVSRSSGRLAATAPVTVEGPAESPLPQAPAEVEDVEGGAHQQADRVGQVGEDPAPAGGAEPARRQRPGRRAGGVRHPE